ncbi:hypothetical protein [Methylocystis sp. B8]|uniref:hypothetical protein n=1 Tax=Methylocystis sp. B8 TaxID=544938 RepID=UPI0010FEB1AC|nr:hypothetical protein [Methylocystis sp. B8]TLG79020.1 hypothetical protein FEV16_03050 [Methylocystis sp. B8]
MSASTEASFHRVSSRTAMDLLSSLTPRLRLAGRRQRVGAVTVWDGQAGFRLPSAGRNCFRLGVYVTFRRGPDDDDPDGRPPAAAARPAPPGVGDGGGD